MRITVSGLEDATPCTHPVVLRVTRDGVAASGMVNDDLSLWSDAGGVLSVKLSNISSIQHVLSFCVRNPAFARASPAISIAASGISGIREIKIAAAEMGKGDGPARGVPGGQQPMLVVVEDSPKPGFWEHGDAVCGDGFLHFLEECEDGNTRSFDGCSSDCKCENPAACSVTVTMSSNLPD